MSRRDRDVEQYDYLTRDVARGIKFGCRYNINYSKIYARCTTNKYVKTFLENEMEFLFDNNNADYTRNLKVRMFLRNEKCNTLHYPTNERDVNVMFN